jgi:polyferredoxin
VARSRLPLLRRISQIFFLVLFFALLVFTSLRPTTSATSDIHLRAPVRLFFVLDPLVAISNALATHALYRGLLWSLLILLPTLFLGRFFCGWICPMGTLQHFVGNLPSEAKRGKQRIESNRYKRWQTAKYAVLIAGLLAAYFGSMAIGWLDPFSLLVRSIGLAILPAFNFAVRALLSPLEHSHIALIKSSGQSLHAFLQATVLDFRQTHFAQGLILGVLFLLILAASLRVTRLWCRAICPLGAMLGAVSRFSVLGLHKDSASCNLCNRCELHCQGGDDPIGGAPWRKAECLMCMNCVSSCPHGSLTFRFFRNEKEVASPDLSRRKDAYRNCRWCSRCPPHACQYRPRQGPPRAPGAPAGLARRIGVSLPLYPLWRVHEGMSQQLAAPHLRSGRSRRLVDSHACAAHRLL